MIHRLHRFTSLPIAGMVALSLGSTTTAAVVSDPSESAPRIIETNTQGEELVVISAPIVDTEIDERRGMLGIRMEDAPKGVRIIDVIAGTPADRAGLRPGDIIVSREERILTSEMLGKRMKTFTPGEVVAMRVLRDEREIAAPVQIAAWNERLMTASNPEEDRMTRTVLELDLETESTARLGTMERLLAAFAELDLLAETWPDMGAWGARPERAAVMTERDDHDRRGHDEDHHDGPHRIIEVLEEHLPDLFRSGEVHIDIEEGEHGFAIVIEVENGDRGDHGEHGDHGDHGQHGDHRDHHEHGDQGDHGPHGEHGDHGRHGEHHDHGDHGQHGEHQAEMMFEEMHRHFEDFAGDLHERMEHFSEMVHDRFRMMEDAVEERLGEFEEVRHEMAREFERAFEDQGRQLEDAFRMRDERFREAREQLGRRLGTAGEDMGDALRRLAEQNRRLEQRLQRLESRMRMDSDSSGSTPKAESSDRDRENMRNRDRRNDRQDRNRGTNRERRSKDRSADERR